MVAPPPGRFSMTIDWLRRVPSAWIMNRAMVSIGPPAGNGTISLIGFSGYPCAATFGATPRTPAAIAAPKMSRLAIMRSSALRGFAASIHLDDCYVLALHIADVLEALAKSAQNGPPSRQAIWGRETR